MAAISPAEIVQRVAPKKKEGIDLYSRFALAGALGCSITHGAFTPVDVYDSITSGPATIH
jgi:solute carrier family 25 (mitochondrial phosphate transporter), member 3